ncbi:MAG: tetratricopeptide repeat protein [Longimicrobiales bacterium]|nr:tetratricopeptide repeat protein [Longimicrobiales bacterium]
MIGLALLTAAVLIPTDVEAQDGRSRVLIPDLFFVDGTDDDFGKDVAKELRARMNREVGFVSIERKAIEDVLKRFDLEMKELDCIGARQLASQLQAAVVFCATYEEVGDKMIEFRELAFYPVGGGDPFSIDLFTSHEEDDQEAAQQIIDGFGAYVELARFRQYCFEYSELQQWADAERNCAGALELNPIDAGLRFQLAQVYRAQERFEEALTEIDRVLEVDPYKADALNTGGYVAATLGQEEKALDYYTRYLEITPDAAAVRRTIAYDMYQAGDPNGAMQLLEEGLGPDAEIGIYSDYGTYAFNTARELLQERGINPSDEGVTIPADIRDLYETAIESLDRVYRELGDSATPGAMRNVVVARIQLGQLAEAEAFGRELTQTFPDHEGVWVAYAQALQQQDKIDDALRAWSRVGELNPSYPQLYERQANLLLNADRRDEAVPLLHRAVENGFDRNVAARMIFGDAYTKGVQGNRGVAYTVEGIALAKGFNPDDDTLSMLNFFEGYSRYQQGMAVARPETAESARRALPIFREARQLLEGGRAYATRENQNLAQILGAVDQYIEIQELLIERGG